MIILLTLLGACSSGGSLQVTSVQAPPLLPAHPSLQLQVNPVVAAANPLLPDIRAALLAQLMANGQFSQVVSYQSRTDLLMTVDVANVVEISLGERILMGPLAGRNRVGVTVRIIDPATGTVIKSYDAEGNSAAPLSQEGGVSDAIRQLARQVADGAAL